MFNKGNILNLEEQVKKVEEMTHEELLSYAKELEAYKKETVYRLTDEDIVSSMEGRFGFGEAEFIPDDAIEMAVETATDFLQIPYMDYVESLLENHFVHLVNPKVDYFNTTNDFDEIEPIYTVVETSENVEVYLTKLSYEEAISNETKANVVIEDIVKDSFSMLEKQAFLDKYKKYFQEIGEGVYHLERFHLYEEY